MGGGGANRPLDGMIAGLFLGIHHHRLLKAVAILKPFFELQKDVGRLNDADLDDAFFLAAGNGAGDK